MRKSVLTVAVGLALAGMMTGASAVDLNYDTLTTDYGTTKLISGNGEELNIQTNASVGAILQKLKEANNDGNLEISELLGVIGTDPGTESAVLTGTAGGTNYVDENTKNPIALIAALLQGKDEYKDYVNIANKLLKQLTVLEQKEKLEVTGDTSINIGSADPESEPVVLLTVGGDRVLNAGLKDTSNSTWGQTTDIEVIRTGNSKITASAGNTFGLVGGSSAVNVYGICAGKEIPKDIPLFGGALIEYGAQAESTAVTIDGDVDVSLRGHSNAAGVLLSGSALALGGKATSTVTGNSTLTISTGHNEANKVSGAVVGVFGGGLAASTLNGTSSVETQGLTTITADNGVAVGIWGGGAALATEIQGAAWNAIAGIGALDSVGLVGVEGADEADLQKSPLYVNGGTATATSGDIQMAFTDNAVTVGVAGGGLGVAWSGGSGGSSTVNVNTGDVSIELAGPVLSEETRIQLHKTAGSLINQIAGVASNISLDGLVGLLEPVSNAINQSQENYAGAHVGTIGGSILVAGVPSSAEGTKADAVGTTGNVSMSINGGYNVATLGGGMTAAYGVQEQAATASSTVESSLITIKGGDSVLTMAGGAAYATGSDGIDSVVSSVSTVKTAAINMIDGSADGLYGGGLAIDDTGADKTNASAVTGEVTISVAGGKVQSANLSPLVTLGQPGSDSGNPSNRSYVYETADLASYDHANVAILGGGIATGGKASAHSDVVNISLTGGTITGNVFGGGMATIGGQSSVGETHILVDGATLENDIYAGGAVGSEHNQNFATYYQGATSTVETAKIVLTSGEVKGDIHAGGYTYEGSTNAKSTVGSADIIIAATDVFKGSEIDGEGADTANLVLTGGDFDMTRTSGDAGSQTTSNTTIAAFSTVNVTGSLKGVTYEFGDKNETVFTGGPSMIEFGGDFGSSKTATIGTEEATGFVGVTSAPGESSGLVNVVNGAFGVGTDSAAKASDAYGEVAQDAVLYLTGTVDLSKSLISVGSDATEVTGVQIGDKGILVADASGNTTVSGGITLSKNGIYFDNVGVNLAEDATEQTVTFSNGLAAGSAVAWDNVLWSAEVTDLEGKTTYTFKADNALGLDDGVYSFYNDLAADDTLRDRIDSSVYRGEENLRAGMNMAAAAGVQTAAIQGAVLGIDAASRRASLTRDYADGVVGYAEATGIYNKMGGSGDMNEMKVELGGVVVGGDYTMGDWTFGGLVNVGTGTVRGQGDNGGLKNEVDYYGFEAYAAKRFGTFNVVGHVGYTATKNDVTDSSVGYAKADDLDADVWSIGVRGEMSYAMSSACRVVPYVGINYLRVGTDGYTASNGVSVDDVDQDLFTVPVGAAFTGTIATASGWAWTPSVDIAYIGAFGDRDVDADVRSGDALGSVSMDVWSESVGRARVGLEASKGNFGVGVMAGGVFGSDDTSGVFGQIRVRYAF